VAIAERVVGQGMTVEQTQDLVRRRRAASGLTSRERRKWSWKGPGGFKFFVTGPPGARRSDLGKALAAVLTRVLVAKPSACRTSGAINAARQAPSERRASHLRPDGLGTGFEVPSTPESLAEAT
jgi:hypothetical protein